MVRCVPWSCILYLMRTSLQRLQGRQYGRPLALHVTCRKIWGRHSDGIFGRSQDVGRGCPLALHRGPYGDVHRISLGNVLRTSYLDVLTTSLGYFLWRYIEDHMETCKIWWKSNVVLYGYRHFQCIHENRQYLSRHCRRYLNKVWNFKL